MNIDGRRYDVRKFTSLETQVTAFRYDLKLIVPEECRGISFVSCVLNPSVE